MKRFTPSSPMFQGLRMRVLTSADVPALLRLRAQVLAGVADQDLYAKEPDEAGFVRAHMRESGPGETLGVFEGKELVAYGMLGLPEVDDAEHLGHYLRDDETAPARTAVLASCMVNGHYRGRKLQRWLLRERIALARAQGRDTCVAMASLHNHASRHNLMREGLRIGWVGELSGLRRHVFAVNFSNPGVVDEQASQLVDVSDLRRQQELLQEGFWGIDSLQDEAKRIKLVFAKVERHKSVAAQGVELAFRLPNHRSAEWPADEHDAGSSQLPRHARC